MRYWLFALLLPVTLLAKSWVHGESVTASYHDQHLEVVFALQAGDTLLEQGLAIVAADNQVQ